MHDYVTMKDNWIINSKFRLMKVLVFIIHFSLPFFYDNQFKKYSSTVSPARKAGFSIDSRGVLYELQKCYVL